MIAQRISARTGEYTAWSDLKTHLGHHVQCTARLEIKKPHARDPCMEAGIATPTNQPYDSPIGMFRVW